MRTVRFVLWWERGWAFAPALVHQAKVLYARTGEHAARFKGLKQTVLDLQKPEARPQMVRRSLTAFAGVTAHLENLRLAVAARNPTDARYAGWKLVQATLECLALANQVFFTRGLAKALGETDRLPERPEGFEQLVRTIATSPDMNEVLRDSEQLGVKTRQVLRRIQATIPAQTTVREQFQQAYPEMREMVKKLRSACERGDHVAASAEAWALQSDVAMMLSDGFKGTGQGDFNRFSEFDSACRDLGLPDLIKDASGGLRKLDEQAGIFDEKLRRFLGEQAVDLCEIKTLDDLRGFLQRDSEGKARSVD